MDDIAILRFIDLVAGVLGGVMALGLIFIPHVIEQAEKKLDYDISTTHLEEILNKKRDLNSALMRRSRVFGLILLVISFFLLMTAVILF
ncbi:MAG: hypothetical protein ACM3L6_07655 [Deltaproteobacteria bacterium]